MVALYYLLRAPWTEPWAFWGVVVSLLGDLAVAGFFGNLFFVYPDAGELVLEGQSDTLGVVEPSMVLPAIVLLAAVMGFGLFAVALWRSEVLPTGAGLLPVGGFLLLAVQTLAVQLLANVIWALGAFRVPVRARATRDQWAYGRTLALGGLVLAISTPPSDPIHHPCFLCPRFTIDSILTPRPSSSLT